MNALGQNPRAIKNVKYISMYFIIKNILFLILLIIILSCSKNKSPFEDQQIIDVTYINNWPDSLKTFGIAFPDTSLPLPQQRASALHQAKLILIDNLNEMAFSLKISKIYTVRYLCLKYDIIDTDLINYIKSSYKITDAIYMADGSIAIYAYIITSSIIQIIDKY